MASNQSRANVSPPVPSASLAPPTLKDRLVSTALWGVGLTFITSTMPPLAALIATVGQDRTMPLQRWYAGTQLRLTGSTWRTVVSPKVDPKRAYMFSQNHTNLLDHVFMHNATPHYKCGLELEEHFKYPVYGWFMKIRGGIAVKAGVTGQSAEVLANMRREVDRGRCILTFPEGHRTLDGRVGKFRKGTFFLARDLSLPIVPVAVTGAYELMRKGSLLVRPGHEITVYLEDPIETAGLPDTAIPELAEHVRSIVARRVDDYWRQKGWPG